jgi:hypothetical protein
VYCVVDARQLFCLEIIRLPILAKFYLSIDGEQQRECERAALPDSMEIQLGDPDADQLCDATVQHALVFAHAAEG